MPITRMSRRGARRAAAGLSISAIAASSLVGTAGSSSAASAVRVDLKVLVISQGGPEDALAAALTSEGVPFTKIDLTSASRPTVTASFLADTVSTGPRAKYQAVVLPNVAPAGLAAGELSALATYERTYKIREVLAYSYAEPAVGLNYAVAPGYLGTLDGKSATVTPAARAGAFNYLTGPLSIEDGDPAVSETYGYVSTPLAADLAPNASFTPYLTTPLADGSGDGVLAGVYARDGREDLVLTFSTQSAQGQFRSLQHGIITWMTRGVHLGYNRNYFSVHVDDVFAQDTRWSSTGNCTPGEDCPAGTTTSDIRMTAADVDALIAWQNKQNLKLDMVFNGSGSDNYVADNGSDPLLTRFLAVRNQLRWINHTYEHLFLGCQQVTTSVPWTCLKAANGSTVWTPYSTVRSDISTNISWAARKGISIDSKELVSGEHSGLFIKPQQPADSPEFIRALTSLGIRTTGSDASRDPNPRLVKSTSTLPRYPMSVYFNVGNRAEMMDEYNWIYTSRADGGSGICEDNPLTVTCITPKTAADFDTYLLPLETTIDMRHIVANDPRPHYVHASNLTEQRLLYPMLDSILARYRGQFATNTPMVSPTMTQASAALTAASTWQSAQSGVTAYTLSGRMYVSAGSSVSVPITVPTGTDQLVLGILRSTFGDSYQGERSAWKAGTSTLILPATSSV